MKALFYFRTHQNDLSNQGVIQKCAAYTRAFQSHGVEVDTVWYDDKGLLINENVAVRVPGGSVKKSPGHLLLFYLLGDLHLARTLAFDNYDFFLIRHMPVHPAFLQLLKRAKKKNPRLRILIEMPTWPYDDEMMGLVGKSMLLPDRLFRSALRRFTDRFLHYGMEREIWGVPTIFVQNGIDMTRIPLVSAKKQGSGPLRMIFIGSMGYWHGLDRLLEGIRIHLDGRPAGRAFELKILGNGAESEEIKAAIRRLKLEDVVEMIPPCQGEAFDRRLADADIGIGTLGLHRIGLSLNSALKHRSYCAYGLPFVFAGHDADFPADYPFCLRFPSDESPVSILAILEFMESLGRQYPDAASRIRAHAEAQLDWRAKVEPVLGYLE